MNKILTLVFLLFIASSFCFAETTSRQNNGSQSLSVNSKAETKAEFPNVFRSFGDFFKRIFGKKRVVEDYPANVYALFTNQNEVTANCYKKDNACSQTQMIEITTAATDPENDVLAYEYTVSAGKIIGKGAKVVWDLSGVAPGTYIITAGVANSCGVCGMTKTQTVKVIECPNCH